MSFLRRSRAILRRPLVVKRSQLGHSSLLLGLAVVLVLLALGPFALQAEPLPDGAPTPADQELGTPPLSADPPLAPQKMVIDHYWGIDIPDPYQYMENTKDPDVQEWARAEDAHTRAWLEDFPGRSALTERVRELTYTESPDYYYIQYQGGRTFAFKRQPPKQQPFLILIGSLDDPSTQRTVVDPNEIDPSGGTSIDFYKPSPDGHQVAVSISKNGTEDGTLYIYDVDSGELLDDIIPRVNGGTAGGSIAWSADGDGFFYTRYPHPGERPEKDLPFYQQIWFHRLGDPLTEDHYVLGESFPKIAEIAFDTSRDGRHVLAQISNGDGGEYEYWLLGTDRWARFAEFSDGVEDARFGPDGFIYLLSRQDAPHKKVLRLDIEHPSLESASTVVPQTEAVITGFAITDHRIWVIEMIGGPTQLRSYGLADGGARVLDMGEMSSVSSLLALDGDEVLIRRQTYTEPPTWYRYALDLETPQPTFMAKTSPADFSDCIVQRIFAPADDGTLIPINLIMSRGTPQDGTAPLVLHGYGSYGISQKPNFYANRLVWIEQGGIQAIASVRGGGEFGDEWHRAANLERKKVSMDDLAACARYLVDQQYTSRDRLAIEGGSAGGLLVFGTMALYPDLMSAVVSHVGIADALRTELSPNGEFNITEFGTVKDETQFHGMYAASPYHHVEDDVQYPAVLSLTGMNDPRVEPWQTFKMTARLQATGTRRPVLMRVGSNTGHGGGTALSERVAQSVDVHTFLFKTFGLEYRSVVRTTQAG